jgi:hypothetical protein
MNLEQALQALEVRKMQLQSRIPAQASAMRTRYLKGMVDEEVEAARTRWMSTSAIPNTPFGLRASAVTLAGANLFLPNSPREEQLPAIEPKRF